MKTKVSLESSGSIPGAKIAIIQSKWHRDCTDRMAEKCIQLLVAAGAERPDVHIVSGAVEIPLAAQRLCRVKESYDAIIAFGIIVKGETLHFEMISHECMRGLGEVMLKEDMPIIIEVIPVFDIEHARARSADDEFNKGIEAAIATIETISWRRAHPARSRSSGNPAGRLGF